MEGFREEWSLNCLYACYEKMHHEQRQILEFMEVILRLFQLQLNYIKDVHKAISLF